MRAVNDRRAERKAQRKDAQRRAGYSLAEAFRRAEYEREELARLRAQYPKFSGLWFKLNTDESEMNMTKKSGTDNTPESDAKTASDEADRESYNEAHGRHPKAPLVGGPMGRGANRHPRGKAPGAPSSKRVSVEYLG